MNKSFTFAVVGGDMRQVHLAEMLANDGHNIFAYALDKHSFSPLVKPSYNIQELSQLIDFIILPLPLTSDVDVLNTPMASDSYSVNDIFNLFSPGQRVIGGKIANQYFEKAGHSGIRLYDYMEREEFNAANAITSAEGAISVAMNELPTTIHGTKSLVCGFGRIGKLLAKSLQALGSDVTVSARKHGDITWIGAYGYTAVNTYELSGKLSEFDLIFNTVPHLIFKHNLLSQLKSSCLCIDLASKPGGIDFSAAKDLDITALWELSIPGRFAPTTAALDMKRTIYNILYE